MRKNYDTSLQLDGLVKKHSELKVCIPSIIEAFNIMCKTYEAGGKLLVCGNGGSAADSEHIVGELMKGFVLKRPLHENMRENIKRIEPEEGSFIAEKLQETLPAISLVSSVSLATAFSNDVEPSLVFAQQVLGLGKNTDTLLAISTSGNSGNVVYASVTARALGMSVVSLTGRSGGRLKNISDTTIMVPADNVADIQELHIPIYHVLCRMLEEYFFG